MKSFIKVLSVAAFVMSAVGLAFGQIEPPKPEPVREIYQNDTEAKKNLKILAQAVEAYVQFHGTYPTKLEDLTSDPATPFLPVNFCQLEQLQGYQYTCVLNANGYLFTAAPVIDGVTGTTVYTITTGGVLKP